MTLRNSVLITTFQGKYITHIMFPIVPVTYHITQHENGYIFTSEVLAIATV